MSTSWTQADIDALEANMKRGILSLQFGDRQIQFQNMAEMLELRREMIEAVSAASESPTSASRTSYAMTRKGSGSAGSRFGL